MLFAVLTLFYIQLPAKHKFIISLNRKASHTSLRRIKTQGDCDVEPDDCGRRKDLFKDGRLVALDIFSGCGGLSEGLKQSGKLFLLQCRSNGLNFLIICKIW